MRRSRLARRVFVGGHRQPQYQQIDPVELHEAQRPARERQVLRRLAVAVVHLARLIHLGGKVRVRPHLIRQIPDRDAERPALVAQRGARLAGRGRGGRCEVGAADAAALGLGHVLGIAVADIDGAHDRIHWDLFGNEMQTNLRAPAFSRHPESGPFWGT